jgi:hypothetical protein
MALQHIIGLLSDPKKHWQQIHDEQNTVGKCFINHVFVLAAIPAVSSFIGSTQVGWRIGVGEPIRLSLETGAVISLIYYLVMLIGVFSMGWVIHAMGNTYGAHRPTSQCIVLAAYTATPLFLSGIMALYPMLWLNLILGLPVLAYTVHLLYTGTPIIMEIPEDRGFLFSTAVLGVGLIAFVALLVVTVLLWSHGFQPV